MICQYCQAEVEDLAFCPHCGHRLDERAESPPQELDPTGKSGSGARRRRVLRRWVLPFLILLVVIAFGVLAMALMGFRDGSQQRDLASRHQAEIHYNRGLIYLEWGQYELAEAEFEEAVRLVPGYTEADDRRRLAQVKQTVTPSPTPSPSATPTATPPTPPTATPPIVVVPITQALFEESQAHYEHGEWEQAISKLEQLRAQDITYRAQETVDMLVQSHR
ncbi:MAG: zinc ribbon domain-containing protein, partial [Planctomycetota bacterium]